MALLFDPEDPPEVPPKGSHPLIWRLAWMMWTEHQQDITGCCRASSCRARWQEWPCEQHHLAVSGLHAAPGNRRKAPPNRAQPRRWTRGHEPGS